MLTNKYLSVISKFDFYWHWCHPWVIIICYSWIFIW